MLELTALFCYNQSRVKLTENQMAHDKTKNIEIKYHYICDMVHKGEVRLRYISTDEQITDILIKPRSRVKFVYFRHKLSLVEKSFISERDN